MSENTNNLQYSDSKFHIEKAVLDKVEGAVDSSTGEKTITLNSNLKVLGSLDISGATYSLCQSPEWIKVLVDSQERIIAGVRTDGSVYIGQLEGLDDKLQEMLNAMQAMLDEAEAEIDAKLAVFNSVFSVVENPEWIQVTTDSEGKILEGITAEGKKKVMVDVKYPNGIPSEIKEYVAEHSGEAGLVSYDLTNQSTQVGFGSTASEMPYSSIYVGKDNLTHATGQKNITIGNDNMIDTSGNENVSLGYHAGFRLTSGSQNTFIGSEAGDDNTSGYNNTAVGSHSLQRNNKGVGNVAIGYRALLGSNTDYPSGGGNRDTGYNVAIGYDALYNLVGGYGNIAIGPEALKNQSATTNNIALGGGALGGSSQVSRCVAIGIEAGKQADGNDQFWLANSNTDKAHALIYGEFNATQIVQALLQLNAGRILMPNLPTSDPQVDGQLWNDNGILKISNSN